MTKFMDATEQLLLPDVDEVLDIGHAIHASADKDLKNTLDQKLAQQIVEAFIALRATPGTIEDAYLRAIKGIARSYGRALSRRKRAYLAEIEAAREERDRKQNRLRENKLISQGWGVLWKFVGPLILGLSGYVVAQVLGGIVPEAVTQRTGQSIPSIILSLTFVFAGRMAAQWWRDRMRDRVVKEYNARCYMAFVDYERGKLREFDLWRMRLLEEWETYTGNPYPKRVSYQMIIKGDIEARRRLEEQLHLHNQNDLQRVSKALKSTLSKLKRKKNGAKAPAKTDA